MRWLAALICAVSFTVQAQVPALIMPNPLGIIITIGQWIYRSNEQIYYIEVAGQGSTAEEARLNGFRLAVEQAVGSLISSESEVQNGRLIRDEIISYAAGFVSEYGITEVKNVPQGVQVSMQVWVAKSKLANRLLNVSKRSGYVDGAQAAAAVGTVQYEQSQGDRILGTVLNDFPRRAFAIELGNSKVSMDDRRQAWLTVPFKIQWSRDYLSSLWAALEATAQDPRAGSNCFQNPTKGWGCRSRSYVAVTSGTWAGITGTNGVAGFADTQRFGQVAQVFSHHNSARPAILLTVKNTQNAVVINRCERHPNVLTGFVQYYQFSDVPKALINGAMVLEAQIKMPVSAKDLENLSQVTMQIVKDNACPNPE